MRDMPRESKHELKRRWVGEEFRGSIKTSKTSGTHQFCVYVFECNVV